jgi:RNA polymerase sigma-70 factor (ECF subfamily)
VRKDAGVTGGDRDPDADLVRRVGLGDRHACAALVDRHLGQVIQVAVRLLGNRADAEEAAQEVFLKVWCRAGSWREGRGRFSTWLYRVTVNQCLDHRRRRREASLSVLDEPVDERAGQDDLAQETEVAVLVGKALARLPHRQRAAVVLTHYQGLSNGEAAEILKVSVDAVESLLVRARRRLRALLRPQLDDLLGGP